MLFYNGLKNRRHDNDTYCHAAHSVMLLWLNMEACVCSATQSVLQQRHMETLPQPTKLSEYNKPILYNSKSYQLLLLMLLGKSLIDID